MKHKPLLIEFVFWFVFVGLVLPGTVSSAPQQSTATSRVSATVVQPLSFRTVKDLRFGSLKSGDTDGTVTVTVDNRRRATGGARLGGVGNYHRAEAVVFGPPGGRYIVQLPKSLISRRDASGHGRGLQVVDLVCFSTRARALTTVGLIGSDGTDVIYIGGTLVVERGAKSGNYRGDVTLNIAMP